MSETWRPIPGWSELYEVSDQGRVRSLPRTIRHANRWGKEMARTTAGRILRPALSRGYERVVLQRDGEKSSQAVHRLVLLAFVGPCPEGMEVCHNDGDKRHNALANLRYDTRSANHLDRNRHGANPNALKTHCPQGHPYSPENTYYGGKHGNSRKCRTCALSRRAARKAAA